MGGAQPSGGAGPGAGKRILVAMSGGVDSSVAAALLVEAGHDVVGVTMKTFCYGAAPGPARSCCGLEGVQDARRVCDALGIPHYVFDLEEAFTRDVIENFVAEYARGRTPNPCVRCNSFTKFRDLLRRATALGCDAVATGHYARLEEADGAPAILRGRDRGKDQTYFLWGLPRGALRRIRFPLGELTKKEVRARARALGLSTADKPESQEVCFVPPGGYVDFLRERLGPGHPALTPGPLVTLDGKVVGTHRGYAAYTVGQRRGLGGGFPERVYVVASRPDRREVVIGREGDLLAGGLEAQEANWLVEPPPPPGAEVLVQIRHRAAPVPAVLEEAGERIRVRFRTPCRAVTPGQSVVLFAGERLLGGGTIAAGLPA